VFPLLRLREIGGQCVTTVSRLAVADGGLVQPVGEAGLGEAGAGGGGEGAFVQFGAVVGRVGVGDDLAGVVALAVCF
jgi:hypothetical protein